NKAAQDEVGELTGIAERATLHSSDRFLLLASIGLSPRPAEYDLVASLVRDTRSGLDQYAAVGSNPRITGELHSLEQAIAGARLHLAPVDQDLARAEPARQALEAHRAIGQPIFDNLAPDMERALNQYPRPDGTMERFHALFPGGKQWFDTRDELTDAFKSAFTDNRDHRAALGESVRDVHVAVHDVREAATKAAAEVKSVASGYPTALRVLDRLQG
ncbi:MAG: hypothetical protein JWM25_3, partial [Thermoleophilia bacterium]|nr:hypothetical protein [Thermoleophilia bacterium]